MSDTESPAPEDCPFHRLLTAWHAAETARATWKVAYDKVAVIHPLDSQFKCHDFRSQLKGAALVYEDKRKTLEDAFDDVLPRQVFEEDL